jgi:G3E family GTPase
LTRERGARIPIVLVTGFLGAGKTTLVKRFLESPAGAGAAVVVNEFGEVGIDHALLRASSETTVLLGNGCVCCAMRSDLETTLAELLAQAATGAVPSFDRVIVETSGLADPVPVLQTFAADRGMGREFHIDAVVALADATLVERMWADAPEARRQLAVADRIVVTKTDLVEPDAAERVLAFVRARNAVADLVVASHGALDPEELTRPATLPRALPAGHAHHSAEIGSFAIEFPAPLPWPVVAHAMDVLMDLRGPDLLRAKGLLAIEGSDGPVVVHAVQHLMHPPAELAAWPGGDRTGRLVFIGRNLRRDAVTALFDAICALRA